MGKSLRTREVLTDTDHDNDEDNTALPISHSVGQGYLRKISKARLEGKSRPSAKISSTIAHNFRLQETSADPLNRQNNESAALRMSHMSGAAHQSSDDDVRTCLLLPLSLVECCLQWALLSLPQWTKRRSSCFPHYNREIHRTVILSLSSFVLPFGDELIHYLCRTTDSLEWSKRRRICNWKQGLVVDFQDRCHVWRRGVIVSTSPTQVEIKISIKGIDLFEKVETTSRRLAPYTFFTRGRYL